MPRKATREDMKNSILEKISGNEARGASLSVISARDFRK
jgi:hypothetical protein